MNPIIRNVFSLLALIAIAVPAAASASVSAAPAEWQDQLAAIPAKDWNRDRAAHLLERAGFGGTPAEVDRFAKMTPTAAVRTLVRYQSIRHALPPFEASGEIGRAHV